MKDLLTVGIGLGIGLYIGKLALFWFASRSCRLAKRLYTYIHHSPILLLTIDICMNYFCSKVIASAPGLTTIIALATFQLCSIGYCIAIYSTNKATEYVIEVYRRYRL
jgi:hypothetical protein